MRDRERRKERREKERGSGLFKIEVTIGQAEYVHRQPAQCPDSPNNTTGNAVGCLQAPSRPLLSLPEEGLWFSTSLLLILKFCYSGEV